MSSGIRSTGEFKRDAASQVVDNLFWGVATLFTHSVPPYSRVE